MNDGKYPPLTDSVDDLPRTLRRERESRERAQREQLAAGSPSHNSAYRQPEAQSYAASDYAEATDAYPAVVTRFNVPFFSLMAFFIKAVLAAIPALILLAAILYGSGLALKSYFPWLVQTEILIRFPK
ncbi:MAG: hypothetical protein SH859_01290 [Hyphomicrobium aestuarii]|nr:hypothetical protein [Hyphomicrobium aestuarii]